MRQVLCATNLLRPVLAGLLLCGVCSMAAGQGIAVTGVGPVNRSMGGAGVAAPLDAIGALHWNPASISNLPENEVSFGIEALLADISLTSTIGGASNTTSGEAGVAMIPSVGWVHHVEDTPVTIGLGLYGIAGFRNNMPADPANPLLATGPVFADSEIVQIAPTMSFEVTERISIGFSPTLSIARMMFNPLGPSVITPGATAGTGNRSHWGGGFQVGLHYEGDNWQSGVSFKSPQWFEDFRFFTPGGVVNFDLDYPMIISTGLAYTGFEKWVFAADVRYLDYKSAAGFSDLGWRSVFAAAFGAQYRCSDMVTLRAGYNVNQNPIQSEDAFANLASPLIQEHNIAAGASCRLTSQVEMTIAYVYLVNNDVTGPLPSPPFGPTDTLTHEISAHSLAIGLRVKY